MDAGRGKGGLQRVSEGVWERSMTGAMEQSKGRRAMEHRIIFATSNQGKMREIREILKGLGTEILSMKEAGVQADIVEDGDTPVADGVFLFHGDLRRRFSVFRQH